MDHVKITTDHNDMVEIGKNLFQSKPNTYCPEVVAGMKHHIDRVMPDASDLEKEEALYCAIYDSGFTV